MEDEEVCYSSVSFVKSEETKASEGQHVETQSEETVYSGVKKTNIQAGASPSQPADDATLPGRPRCHCAVVALGVLTAVLLAALVASVTYFQIAHDNAKQHLHSQIVQQQEEMKTLEMERDHLNMTLGVIFQFKEFQVDDFCPIVDNSTQERKCSRPCKEGWIYNQSRCYQFNEFNDYSKHYNWEESKKDCHSSEAHLVIIDTLEKQIFINDHTKEDGEYWIGLRKNEEKKWQWINGNELINGYWIELNDWYNYDCAATVHNSKKMSWKEKVCSHSSKKWICEMEAAVWPD